MVDVKDLLNENIKEFMKEIYLSVKSTIDVSIPSRVVGNMHNFLSLNSQLEPITQDITQPTSRVEDLNNLIDEMDIEKTPNKRKTPTPSSEIYNYNEDTQELANNSNIDSTTKTRVS